MFGGLDFVNRTVYFISGKVELGIPRVDFSFGVSRRQTLTTLP